MDVMEMKQKILELCSEDDYGSWELWWAICQNSPKETIKFTFIKAITDMIDQGLLIAKKHDQSGHLQQTFFSKDKLLLEIDRQLTNVDGFYWFGER